MTRVVPLGQLVTEGPPWHGARVEVEQVLSQGSPVADVVLSFAADQGMDLIVIGAYSHARSVEILFGGVTRTLLKLAPVPLLMSR
jgi:nucleotide-binding universal stress UspA family protein